MLSHLLTKQFIFISLLLSLAANAQDQVNMPLWLRSKLDFYQKSHPDIAAQVTEYNGKIAYYIPSRCCDIPSELYDESGNIICHPNGGFTGGDGKCPSFNMQKKR